MCLCESVHWGWGGGVRVCVCGVGFLQKTRVEQIKTHRRK